MRGIKFRLYGKNAFFKKNDVNSYLYYSYGNIHKVSLLGIFGSILGYDGYNEQGNNTYPLFYSVLNHLKVSIVPLCKNGYIKRSVQTFNNSVGYASKEEGGNLIIKEYWLEDAQWEIYILDDGSVEYQKLCEYITNSKSIYMPYLGKNDHYANIVEPMEIELNNINNINSIDSLFIGDLMELKGGRFKFKYEEYLPYSINDVTNHYIKCNFIHTDCKISIKKECTILNYNEKNLFFF